MRGSSFNQSTQLDVWNKCIPFVYEPSLFSQLSLYIQLWFGCIESPLRLNSHDTISYTMASTDYKASAVPAGVWCPVVTLYKDTPRQEVDLDAMYTYFSHLISSGVNGLVLQGSTAEAALLLPEERVDLTRIARKAATDLGVPNFPLAAGISGQSTTETLRLVDDAAAAGADFGLLLPPSYWPKAVSNPAIVDFYSEVADHSRIPIIVYNVSPLSRKLAEEFNSLC